MDALAAIVDEAKVSGNISGLVGHTVTEGGVIHLQYTNDTMIMVERSELDIINLKFLLLLFEAMPGLKINFDKSEVVVMGYADRGQP